MNPLYQQYYGLPQMTPGYNPNYFQDAMTKARQIMQTVQNPQQFVLQSFGNIPPAIQNNPDQIIQYLQANNMLNPYQQQILSMLRR